MMPLFFLHLDDKCQQYRTYFSTLINLSEPINESSTYGINFRIRIGSISPFVTIEEYVQIKTPQIIPPDSDSSSNSMKPLTKAAQDIVTKQMIKSTLEAISLTAVCLLDVA